MKNNQRGFIVSLLITIIGILIIGGGLYIYSQNRSKNSQNLDKINQNSPSVSNQQTPTQSNTNTEQTSKNSNNGTGNFSNQATISEVKQYIDSNFGFSFWYPSAWQVTKATPSSDYDSNITKGTVLAELIIGNKDSLGNTQPQISIQEVHSPSLTITDTFGTDKNQTYYFDLSAHTWMTIIGYQSPFTTNVANVSTNTMGGLHMFGGSGQYSLATIIPLSADNFIVVNQLGDFDSKPLIKTILALDQSVANPVSTVTQRQTLQAMANTYSKLPTSLVINWNTYINNQIGFSFQYPDKIIGASIENSPNVYIETAGPKINLNGCYITDNPNGQRDSQKTIGEKNFCFSSGEDVGAGQRYNNYYYTTFRNGQYITIGYTIHTSNSCGAVKGAPSYIACIYYNKNSDIYVIQPIEKSIGTIIFTK